MTDLTHPSTSGTLQIRTMDDLSRLSRMLAESGYFKDAKGAAQAGVKVLAAFEAGFGAIAGMMGVHIVDGKPTYGGHLIASAIKRHPRYDYRITEHNDEACEIQFYQDGAASGRHAFTMADAKRASLAGRGPWKTYPRAMLFNRCISAGYRIYCPDVMNGVLAYTPEELGAAVDGEGAPIDVEAVEVEAVPVAAQAEEGPKLLGSSKASDLHKALGKFDIKEPQRRVLAETLAGRKLGSFADLTLEESRVVYAAGQNIGEGSATPHDYGIPDLAWETGRIGEDEALAEVPA